MQWFVRHSRRNASKRCTIADGRMELRTMPRDASQTRQLAAPARDFRSAIRRSRGAAHVVGLRAAWPARARLTAAPASPQRGRPAENRTHRQRKSKRRSPVRGRTARDRRWSRSRFVHCRDCRGGRVEPKALVGRDHPTMLRVHVVARSSEFVRASRRSPRDETSAAKITVLMQPLIADISSGWDLLIKLSPRPGMRQKSGGP